MANRHTAHTIYRNAAGKRVPGTTTISGVLDKSRYLVPWANKLGQEGIDSEKYVDEKARAGTLAHAMCLAELGGEPPVLADYTTHEISQAENSYLKFLDWMKRHRIGTMMVERPLVSEVHQFGGTIDLLCVLDDVTTLLDIKTSKAIYDEHWIQVAGYGLILTELGYDIGEARILQIGRDETEGFSEEARPSLTTEAEIFIHCRAIYELQKKARKER